ncbi:kinesin-like protein KIN-14E isoform X2 [Homarus americanus]|uniref:Kinesin-like protein n=1 Tax=Homarus americanus TaxID=6706 RepID=A0A8J5JG69_HOMAM|nr:kinesin-like protein KIN-14E isoform X2 [Homarus americanus]KAG7155673.1 Kinesin-like protein KIN-14E-like [Homarus americanus]
MDMEFDFLYIHQDRNEHRSLHVIKEEVGEEDTFHDSGTSGHEPDSLEAIQTVVNGGDMVEGRPSPPSPSDGDVDDRGGGEGRGGKPEDAAILLHLERCSHRQTRRTLHELKEKYETLQHQLSQRAIKLDEFSVRTVGSDLESLHIEQETILNSLESLNSIASSDRLVDELKLREMTISQLRSKVLQLEKDRLDKVPFDAAKEITRLNNNLIQLEKARDELTIQNFSLKSKLSDLTTKINDPAATYQIAKESLSFRENLIQNTENGKLKDVDDPDVVKVLRKATYKVTNDTQKLRQMCTELVNKEEEYKKRITDLETEVRNLQNENSKRFDKAIREMENRLEITSQKLEAAERYLTSKEEEGNMLKLDIDTLNDENKRLKENLNELILKQKDYLEETSQKAVLEGRFTRLAEENRVLAEDFNRERVLRKKYYNQVEEMKGKIRVFCRVRPMSEGERRQEVGGEVTAVEDEFTLAVNTQRGHKSFLFDRVFQPHDDQDAVFQDTNALIQSALDGFNATIMAYGQTGSGKTYTMLGTQANPGIAPRAFQRLFQLVEGGKARHDVYISAYMMELYNDKLIDLFKPVHTVESERLEIKRDKKGSVHVQGATVRNVTSARDLGQAFEEGLMNRHTASTKMNVESSRSHLLIVICLNVTSKQTGNVLKGKLTLVDLAGSERVSKSGASADQLREANSINKSLSALGDVISALSSESSFVPYRNSKLTMLLQDSLGGNAKTLVFVNVSPASYNADETLISLMYASRIKQITNNISKNSDNKEISRLKSIINKLKKGEYPDEEAL